MGGRLRVIGMRSSHMATQAPVRVIEAGLIVALPTSQGRITRKAIEQAAA